MINISSSAGRLLDKLEISEAVIRPENMTAVSAALRESMGDVLINNGFPPEARLSPAEMMSRDNSDVWDAYVSYMADREDTGAATTAELDAAVAELAADPDADAASLDALVARMNESGTDVGDAHSLKDALGTGVLVNIHQRLEAMIDHLGEKIGEVGEVTREELGELADTTGKEVDAAYSELEPAQQLQVLETLNSQMEVMNPIMETVHEAQMDVIQNISYAEVEVIEGQPDSAVIEAERDDGRDQDENDSPDNGYADTHDDTIA